jgi:exodeoxyribonuclease VII large subunit
VRCCGYGPGVTPGLRQTEAVDEATFSVTELNTVIRDALREAVPENVWVRGEVQGLRESRAGHVYFQLVEKDERRDRVQAALDVALFRSHLMTVHAALRKTPGVELPDDVEVRVKGHIDVYPPTGRLQLIMTGIDPVFTAGALAANRDRVLRTLEAEGLLRANATRDLPAVPLRIGLVTSAASAAYHDFLDELERSAFAFRVGVCDVRVQGANAPRRLVWALRRMARIAPELDAVVIVRGGGSRSDLAPFDSETVAREIAAMPVPVFTGIGHEIDRTVADEVAHTCCKTPTATGQAMVERVAEFVDRLDTVSRGVVHHARSNCAIALRELSNCARRARRGPPIALARELVALERHRGRAEELGTRAAKRAEATLEGAERRLSSAGGRLTRAETRRLDASEARLRALDPARVLERGYTITRDGDGHVVKRVATLNAGDRLVTEFSDGTAVGTVDEIEKRKS